MSDRKEAGGASNETLRRDIGFFGSSAIVFNGVVGAGIFALPAVLAADFGGFSPWLFPIFGVLILCVAWPFAHLADRFEGTGGPIAYVEEAYGPAPAFQVGWLYYLARVTAFAANVHVLVRYAASIVPPLADEVFRDGAALAVCAALTALNIVGVKRAVGALTLMSVLKAAPIVIGALIGLVLHAERIPAPEPLPPLSSLEAAALVTLYAFIGFEGASVTAGETREPKRTIGRSYIHTLLLTAMVYILVQLAYMAVLGEGGGVSDAHGEGGAPLVVFGEALAGPIGGVIFVLAAVFSLTGNLTASMLSAPRLPYAIARRGALPAFFAQVSGHFGTPALAILFTGALAGVLALSGGFVFLAVMSTLARLIVYFASIASLPIIIVKRREPRDARFLRAIAGAVLGGAVSLWIIAQAKPDAWERLAYLVAVGLALFGVQALWRRVKGR